MGIIVEYIKEFIVLVVVIGAVIVLGRHTIDYSRTVEDTPSILKNYWKDIKNTKIKIK